MLYRRPNPHASGFAKDGDSALSSFAWNEMVFRSFQVGFLKQLDLDFYRCLKLAAAKRMYRFLDKRFHFSNELHFSLPVFACEHIGLSRSYDAAQLKRRLNPAIEELERAGYLAPLSAADRFNRLRRGQWEILFVRAPKVRKPRRAATPLSDLESRLVERGVAAASAAQLVREYAADFIEGKIEVFDALRENHDRRVSKNPPGYLVQSIRRGYVAPVGFLQDTPRRSDGVKPVRRPTGAAARRKPILTPPHSELDGQVESYLASLSPEHRDRLERDAIANARGLAAQGLRRAVTSGNAKLADQYRQAIVSQHVTSLLNPVRVQA